MGMKFFTDKTVVNDYLLVKIKDYIKMKDFSRWKEVFIDPGVYDLTKSDKFKWEGTINIKEFLDSLPENHYFSYDYPGDMNLQYQDLFLQKSWENALRYNCYTQYIVTAQYKFKDYWNFVKWFDKYNRLHVFSKILGLGNMCRFRSLNNYLKHALDYAFSHCRHTRIHIYGLCLKAIPYVYNLSKKYNIELSMDSTKWTRACIKELKDKYNGRVCCTTSNRQEFFDEYKKKNKRGDNMSIEKHQKDYKPEAWKNYTIAELGWWVHLLTKRSEHRSNQEKKEKDLYDASNYLWMLQQKLKEFKK